MAYQLLKRLPLFTPPPRKLKNVNCEDALKLLHSIHPDVGSSCIRKTDNINIVKPDFDLDIIIPVYNVAKFLTECIESVLYQQTRFRFHVTIVNDGSTDNSRQILMQYEKNDRVTIIDQENKGFSGARNTGLFNSRGRYVMFVDSDDRLPQGAIEILMSKAFNGNYDMVGGGHVRFNAKGILDRQIPKEGKLTGFAWGKVYKKEVWNGIQFPEKYWFEDTINAFIINNRSLNISTVNKVVYEWRRNTNSISFTSKGETKILDTVYITLRLIKDCEQLGEPTDNNFRLTLIHQLKVNAIRIQSLGNLHADWANYVISKTLYDKYCNNNIQCENLHNEISSALSNNDFNQFILASVLL